MIQSTDCRVWLPIAFCAVFVSMRPFSLVAGQSGFAEITASLGDRCVDCHGGSDPEGDLDLTHLTEPGEVLGQPAEADLATWINIHDRVAAGEMPPEGGLPEVDKERFLDALHDPLVQLDRRIVLRDGRAVRRRMNRFEYENRMRELLGAPWLQLASILPEDGELHRFNKIGEELDVSHVNLARYMQAADHALRAVIAREVARPESPTIRYYARQQESFNRRVHYTVFNRSPERATFPLLGYQADLKVLQNADEPFTVGDNHPEKQEQEAFGVVASSYEPIENRFSEF